MCLAQSSKILLTTLLIQILMLQTGAAYQHEKSVETFVPSWVKDAIFYQIFPERFANGDPKNDPPNVEPWGGTPKTKNYFGGDLRGIMDHLDYISALGVNCLYLNPIFWSNSNHKYHTKDYLKIDPHFGTEEDFKNLVDACHKRGIRIILDGVFNHTGVDFFAFEDIKKHGKKSKYVKWYNIYSFPINPPDKPNYECWWNLGDLPKLMTHNPEVRAYLFKATEHWMKLGIDGWRLDVPNEIPHPFWVEWRKLVKNINPEAYIVGEVWDDASPWLKGDQFDAVMNYRFRNAALDFFVNGKTTVKQFDSTLAKVRSDYAPDVNLAMQNLLGSHDTERLLTLCKNDKQTMKLAWLFQMTYVGAPMVYYGDEVGMTGGKDPGCRGTMIWDESKQDRDLLATMQELIKLRKQNTVLRDGSFASVVVDPARNLYGFVRTSSDKRKAAFVLLNNGTARQSVDCSAITQLAGFTWSQAYPRENPTGEFKGTVTMDAKSGIVLLGSQ